MLIPFEKEEAVLCVDIPMRNRQREIVALTTVSAEDYDWASLHPWHRTGGYAYGEIDETRCYLHRMVMQRNNILPDTPEQTCVDHIDRDKLNNTRQNLRWATVPQNHKNRSIAKSNKSGCTGVRKQGKKWAAVITHNNKKINLGTFIEKEEAIAARHAAEKKFGIGEPQRKKLRLQ